jgi:hypothetical protein
MEKSLPAQQKVALSLSNNFAKNLFSSLIFIFDVALPQKIV